MTYEQQLASPYPMRSALTGTKNAAGELTTVTWAVAEPVDVTNGLRHIVHSYFFYNTPHDGWRLSPEPLDDGRAVSFERAVALLHPFDPPKQEADNNSLCIVDDMRALAGLIDDENEIELPDVLADKLRLIQHYSRRMGQLHCTTDTNGNVVSQGKAGLPVGKVHVPAAALVATNSGLVGLGPLTEQDDLAVGHKIGDWLYAPSRDDRNKANANDLNDNFDDEANIALANKHFKGIRFIEFKFLGKGDIYRDMHSEHKVCAIFAPFVDHNGKLSKDISNNGIVEVKNYARKAGFPNHLVSEDMLRNFFANLDNMTKPNRIIAERNEGTMLGARRYALRAFDQLRAEQVAALEAEADAIKALPAPGLPDPAVPRLKTKAPQQS